MKKNFIFLLIFILMIFACHPLSAKIRLLTFHYNKPEFLEQQCQAFKKFLLDDYELIVFNDAKDPLIAIAIQNICEKYDVQCVRYEQQWHLVQSLNNQIAKWLTNPTILNIHRFISPDPFDIGQYAGVRHCHVIKYALENFGYIHDDIVGLIDGDAFLIRPFSIRSLLGENQIAGIQKPFFGTPGTYLWVVFTIFDPGKLPDARDLKFDYATVGDIIQDTGSLSHYYLLNHPEVKVGKIPYGENSHSLVLKDEIALLNEGYSHAEVEMIKDNQGIYIEFHLNKHLLHYVASSYGDENPQKEINVLKFLNTILQDESASAFCNHTHKK